jgi:hypothetical protein
MTAKTILALWGVHLICTLEHAAKKVVALEGKLDSLGTDEGHRVVAPFPVPFVSAKFRIPAHEGVARGASGADKESFKCNHAVKPPLRPRSNEVRTMIC